MLSMQLYMKYLIIIIFILPLTLSANESTCHGTTSNGYLENGVQIPAKGANYISYSSVARLAGRTYVHSKVQNIIINTYSSLKKEHPEKIYKYAETGYKDGGQFPPHKTHQNGLSVDFMTPVMNSKGRSVHLPTHALNKFGYNIEFDKHGKYKNFIIDYEAMAAHIAFLHKNAKSLGNGLWRVIFAPELQAPLFKTKYGSYLKKNITFSKKRSWVRHDEHYHVDFSISCKKIG